MAGIPLTQQSWRCRNCDHANQFGVASCGNCGLPAVSSAEDLAEVRRLGSVEAVLAEKRQRKEAWAKVPLWQKVLGTFVGIIVLVGLVLLRLGPIELNFIGLFIVGVVLGVGWLFHIFRRRRREAV